MSRPRLQSMRWVNITCNIAIIITSILATLLLCEFCSRLFFDPVDYLSPRLERDPVLGIKLPPGTSGHDAWGFRNRAVPPTAAVVTLGDSHTYGNTAKMAEAWPQVLSRRIGLEVYNCGMGGYGPNQYYHLLKATALQLKPKVVLCGIYMGDDFDNAYRITYGLDHWSSLRKHTAVTAEADIWQQDTAIQPSWHKRIRVWLSEHSIVYRLITQVVAIGIKGRLQVNNASRLYDSTFSLVDPDKDVSEAFRPKGLLGGLDQKSPTVQEGMRLTFELLQEMNVLCTKNGIRFLVVIIPTKESVFARYFEQSSTDPLKVIIKEVIVNESIARQKLVSHLQSGGIPSLDLLPALIEASIREKIYVFSGQDMHPNRNGYRVIGETISAHWLTAMK